MTGVVSRALFRSFSVAYLVGLALVHVAGCGYEPAISARPGRAACDQSRRRGNFASTIANYGEACGAGLDSWRRKFADPVPRSRALGGYRIHPRQRQYS